MNLSVQKNSHQKVSKECQSFHIPFVEKTIYIGETTYRNAITLFEIMNFYISFVFKFIFGDNNYLNNIEKTKTSKNPQQKRIPNYTSLFLGVVVPILVIFSFFLNSHLVVSHKENEHPWIMYFLYSNSIIGGVGIECKNESLDQGRSYFDEQFDISGCFFSRMSQLAGWGGVIYVQKRSLSLSIYNSIFYNCSSSLAGGALYLSCSNSSLIMICAYRCSSAANHFAFLDASKKNYVEYVSLSYCSYITSGVNPIQLYTGDQIVDSTNSSMNNANQVSGIRIDYSTSFSSSYCTFSNNNVAGYICIYLYSASGIISSANIVHNNSPSSSFGVVRAHFNPPIMKYCIFQDNQNTLFSVSSGSLVISDSFLNHSGIFSTLTSVSTAINNSFTKTMTYQMQFFKSIYCNAELPLPERTLGQSPMNTVKETLMNTVKETLMNTHEETPMNTHEETLMKTVQETPMNTPQITTNQDLTNTSSTTIVITILSLIVIIIGIVFGISLLMNQKRDISNSSHSKSEDMKYEN